MAVGGKFLKEGPAKSIWVASQCDFEGEVACLDQRNQMPAVKAINSPVKLHKLLRNRWNISIAEELCGVVAAAA